MMVALEEDATRKINVSKDSGGFEQRWRQPGATCAEHARAQAFG